MQHVIFNLIQYVDNCHNPILFQYMCEHAPGKSEYTSGYAINWAGCPSTSRTDYRKCTNRKLSQRVIVSSQLVSFPQDEIRPPVNFFKHWNHFLGVVVLVGIVTWRERPLLKYTCCSNMQQLILLVMYFA